MNTTRVQNDRENTTSSRCIALIPARGGSKGITNKNLAPLNGRPLIAYSIQAARDSGLFHNTIVSSDNSEILVTAKRLGAEQLARNPELATDTAPMDPVIAEAIDVANLDDHDIICLLQPTSPVRTAQHIQQAFELFHSTACEAVISVYPIDNKVLKAYVLEEKQHRVIPIHSEETSYQRRQDLPQVVMPNGALYIFSVGAFKRHEGIPRSSITPLLMSAVDSVDVDDVDDLQHCAALLTAASGGQHNVRI